MDTTRGQAPIDLDGRLVEAIAAQVVKLLRDELGLRSAPVEDEWIDAKEVARRTGFSRAWVYAHARQLGGVPTGSGPRPRLRFDPRVVEDALRASGQRLDESWPAGDPAVSVPIHVPHAQSRHGESSNSSSSTS
jgi:hypothetical protein